MELLRVNPGNRAKSASDEHNSQLCSIARCEVCVRHEVGICAPILEHSLKDGPVFLRRLNQNDTGLVIPALHPVHGFLQCQGRLMQPGIGGDVKEGSKYWPAQAYGGGPAQLVVPPGTCRLVMGGKAVLRVEQDVCIHQNHW